MQYQPHIAMVEQVHQKNKQQPKSSRAKRYDTADEEDIGLGNPQNLAAFDLPLSQDMSNFN
jgi:hypothetical protein